MLPERPSPELESQSPTTLPRLSAELPPTQGYYEIFGLKSGKYAVTGLGCYLGPAAVLGWYVPPHYGNLF